MVQLPLVRPAAEQPSLDYRSYPSRLRVHESMSTVTENRVDSSIKPFFDALEITLFRALEHFHVCQNRKGRHRGNFEPTFRALEHFHVCQNRKGRHRGNFEPTRLTP